MEQDQMEKDQKQGEKKAHVNKRRKNKMPRLDGTGPAGKGKLTGRQLGNCEGALSRGRGFGPCGRGRGFGRGFARTIEFSSEQKKKILEAELAELNAEQEEIEKQLKELN